jgi:GT2 family glycosyltransferase
VTGALPSRNSPCPCGSGRRYKDCHGALDAPSALATLESVLLRALGAQQAGRLDDAARAYERALELAPDHFDALHMLGVVHFQRGSFARARELVARAAAMRPDVGMAQRNLRLVDSALLRERWEARYASWIDLVERPDRDRRAALRAAAAAKPAAPRFSIITPTYDSPEEPLRACLESVLAQDYPHWELCIADDASPAPHVVRVLSEYAQRDVRIRVAMRERNGHISAASNSALALATGEFVALLDHDDLMAQHALGEVATEILAHPDAAIVYSDEDKVDASGRRFDPYFKPGWNPALLTAQNYVSHLGVYRTSVVRAVGGFREGVEGAQDWDLLLRCAERVDAGRIRHVPRILYHWRAIQGSTARTMESKRYAADAQERVVAEAFARRGVAVRMRRVLRDNFLECDPVAAPPPAASVVLLGRAGPHAAAWRLAARDAQCEVHAVDVPAAALDGRPRAIGREAAGAINAAVRAAACDVVLFADAGCAPPPPERLAAWIARAAMPDAGPVGALVEDANGDIAAGAFVLDPVGIAASAWHGEAEGVWGMAGRAALVQNVAAVTIEAMAVRRDLWAALGGLDAATFAARGYDVDFCLRAAASGCRTVWHPGVVLRHAGTIHGSSVSVLSGDADADAVAMRARWGALLAADPAYNPNLSHAPRLFELALPGTAR